MTKMDKKETTEIKKKEKQAKGEMKGKEIKQKRELKHREDGEEYELISSWKEFCLCIQSRWLYVRTS